MTVTEVNFDGLVGPTHNYGGLSLGNVASMNSEESASNPREAALQGLAKMRRMLQMGFTQGFLPPHDRPHVETLRRFGLMGSDREVIEKAGKETPLLLRNCSSASAMWTANAATVTPSVDSGDGRVHFTPANLKAMFHRSIEHRQTEAFLRAAFSGERFAVHEAIPGGGEMGDEGAANHGRLATDHSAPGLHLYTYGRQAFDRREGRRFPARQALAASLGVARQHGIGEDRSVFLKQADKAIDAGAFHNDVVAVANGPVLLYHQHAYERTAETLDEIRRKAEPLGFEPVFVEVPATAVSLEDAIQSYLFNSQLLTRPDGSMMLLLPAEAEENEASRAWCEEAVAGNGPISETLYTDLRQSMRNGGGPACLRLRVALDTEELADVHRGFLLDEERISTLEAWVSKHYRDRLTPEDLGDPDFLDENRRALDELTQIMGVTNLYGFQEA